MQVKLAGVFQFLKQSLSEPQGDASFSRISAGIIISFVLMWVTYLVFKTHAMPDLAGPTLFLTGGATATYGTNKVATAFSPPPAVSTVSTVPPVSTVPAPTQVGN